MNDFSPKEAAFGCVGVLIAAIVLLCVLSIQIVQPGMAAVATRFGTLDKNVYNQGFYVQPFASFTYYDTKVQIHQAEQDAATKDLQNVKVDVTLSYRLQANKLMDLFQNVGSNDDLQTRIIDPEIAQDIKAVTTKFNAEDLLHNRELVKSEILSKMSELLPKYYADAVDVSVTNVTFTDEFNKAIENKQIAQQQAEQQQFELQKTKLIAEQNQVQAQALTDAILEQQAIAKWDGKLPTTMYVANGSATSIFGIPIK